MIAAETDRPRCGCTRAAVDDQGATCSLCTVDVLHDEALRAAPLPREARPTVAYPRCPCGGALDPQHRCVDPVAEAVALHLAADDADEALDRAQRAEVQRQVNASRRQRTAERLARGPG